MVRCIYSLYSRVSLTARLRIPRDCVPNHISRFQHAITKNSESLLKLDKIVIKRFHVTLAKSNHHRSRSVKIHENPKVFITIRGLAGNLKLGGLRFFFPSRYVSRFFKNHCFQKMVTEFLINPPILNC